ncbi:hypothetical protein DFH11DRAFT_741075 [Phellopilus nigrolimitatus]|nr:hypothetical protein DFH11DRAFT_741075 [Phellopilus nigrolimitatus]
MACAPTCRCFISRPRSSSVQTCVSSAFFFFFFLFFRSFFLFLSFFLCPRLSPLPARAGAPSPLPPSRPSWKHPQARLCGARLPARAHSAPPPPPLPRNQYVLRRARRPPPPPPLLFLLRLLRIYVTYISLSSLFFFPFSSSRFFY